jgi:hypothetical protein
MQARGAGDQGDGEAALARRALRDPREVLEFGFGVAPDLLVGRRIICRGLWREMAQRQPRGIATELAAVEHLKSAIDNA